MVEETKKLGKKPKMFEELERKYVQEAGVEQELKRLEKMKEIREKMQPIDRGEIEHHARKYEEVIRQKKDELKRKRGGLMDSQYDSANDVTKQVHKSRFYTELLD